MIRVPGEAEFVPVYAAVRREVETCLSPAYGRVVSVRTPAGQFAALVVHRERQKSMTAGMAQVVFADG